MLAFADAALTSDERRLLSGFVDALEILLGDELSAVWLFGSRARGERRNAESDVDVLVLARDASWDAKERIHDTLTQVATELSLDALPWTFAVHIQTPQWLAERRRIQSFFIAEVDKDKVVLFGDA